jgi:hypothetical protein
MKIALNQDRHLADLRIQGASGGNVTGISLPHRGLHLISISSASHQHCQRVEILKSTLRFVPWPPRAEKCAVGPGLAISPLATLRQSTTSVKEPGKTEMEI